MICVPRREFWTHGKTSVDGLGDTQNVVRVDEERSRERVGSSEELREDERRFARVVLAENILHRSGF